MWLGALEGLARNRTTSAAAGFGWYASEHDADVDEGLCAVIGGGRVSATRLADGSLRFASSASPASPRASYSYVMMGVPAWSQHALRRSGRADLPKT